MCFLPISECADTCWVDRWLLRLKSHFPAKISAGKKQIAAVGCNAGEQGKTPLNEKEAAAGI